MLNAPFITIDDSLRLFLARLEGALGVFFKNSEIDRVFSDARENQVDEKQYVFFDSPSITVKRFVDHYEPEDISISISAPRYHFARCRSIVDLQNR